MKIEHEKTKITGFSKCYKNCPCQFIAFYCCMPPRSRCFDLDSITNPVNKSIPDIFVKVFCMIGRGKVHRSIYNTLAESYGKMNSSFQKDKKHNESLCRKWLLGQKAYAETNFLRNTSFVEPPFIDHVLISEYFAQHFFHFWTFRSVNPGILAFCSISLTTSWSLRGTN